MPDFDAIAAAVALRYAAAQVTPPAGMQNIRRSSADLPQALTVFPVVLVFPDAGTFDPGNGTRIGTSSWIVRFYYSLARDLARETNALRKWLKVLVDQHLAGVQLGGIVVSTRTFTWKIGQMTYGGKEYSGIELGVAVVTSEPWTPTA